MKVQDPAETTSYSKNAINKLRYFLDNGAGISDVT